MSNFAGITPDAMWLLAENRFHDSKSFYEEKKPQIQAQVLRPLRALLEDLTPFMLDIDPQFVTEPGRNGNISRIRRDNRYTRDKSMYRENAWIVFEREQKGVGVQPRLFCGYFRAGQLLGHGLLPVPARFPAVPPSEDGRESPVRLSGRWSGRRRPASPPWAIGMPAPKAGRAGALDGLYNRKSVDMIREESDMAFFGGPELADTLRRGFAELAPLYHLLMEAIEAFAEIPPDHR